MKTSLLLLIASSSIAVTQTCYSADGQALDSKYQPCFPNAASSACCQLNGTQGTNQQNDICLDSGLCQSTSGWYAGFLYINGCTDPTGQAEGCPKLCNAVGSPQYSWSVLQCQPGIFCCRPASDTTNCCNDTSKIVNTTHIGSLLLPGTTKLINTTFDATNDNSPDPSSNSTSNSTCTTSSSTSADTTVCPADNSAVVGGAVGGVLGAALIGALIALFFALKGRKHYKSQLNSSSTAMSTAEGHAAQEKAALERQIQDLRNRQLSNPPNYTSPKGHIVTASELPHRGSDRSELSDPNFDTRYELH